jgi:hypothetical protein
MGTMSFPHRRESSGFHKDLKLFPSWIPASAGMTGCIQKQKFTDLIFKILVIEILVIISVLVFACLR